MATIAEKLAAAALTDNLTRSQNPVTAPYVKTEPGKLSGKLVPEEEHPGYTASTAFVEGFDQCYYSTSAFSSSASQYAYVIARLSKIGVVTGRQGGLWIHRDEADPVNNQNGYRLIFEKQTGTNNNKFILQKVSGGEITELKALESTAFPQGSQIALVVGNGKVYVFARATEEEAYTEVMSVSDSAFTSGYTGLYCKGSGEYRVNDLRVGTFKLEETGKLVKLLIGGAIKEVKRWLLIGGELVSK